MRARPRTAAYASGAPRGGARSPLAAGAAAGFAAAALLATAPAAAAPDGAYGRFDGDLDLGVGLGAEVGADPARAAARLTAHHFGMAGVAIGYADPLGAGHPAGRTLALGADLRPLFLPRWSNGLARGPALLDLTLDAISIGIGPYFATAGDGPLGRERGLELSLGLGVPLIGRASGPWLEARGALQWGDGARDPSPPARGAVVLLLGWHQRIESPLVPRR